MLVIYRRVSTENRRLADAVDNMSQGLCTFDAQGRIVLVNRRYIDMYKLSPRVVKTGCTLHDLIQHRKDTGLFSGDVDAYCQNIRDGMAKGQSTNVYVQASDGRIVLAKNEPVPGGGWVSTHEDVTEQRRAEEERAAIQEQEQRRAGIDASITSFRPQVEKLLASVGDSATAMRSTAAALFGSSEQTSQRAESAVQAFHEASTNVETAAVAADRIVALDRRDQPPAQPHQRYRRPRHRGSARDRRRDRRACVRGAEDRRRGQADPQHRRTDQSSGAQRNHRGGARGRGRPRLRRRCLGGQVAGGADGQGDRRDRQPHSRRAEFNLRRGRRDPPDCLAHAGNQ